MARPRKNNAEYFTHDADMRNDVKIKALRRRFQHVGYAVWCFLLESLTDSDDFEIEWDEVNIELFSADYDVSPGELVKIVDYCVRIGLLTLEGGKLHSETHKKRFNALIVKRSRDRENTLTGAVIAIENLADTPKKEVIAIENTHNRVEYSRVEYSRVNKTNKTSGTSTEVPCRSSPDPPDSIDFNALINWFNEMTKGVFGTLRLPLSKARQGMIRARIREYGKEAFCETILRASQSDVLKGQNHRGWVATFDWMIKPTNFDKILTGNYDSKNRQIPDDGSDDGLMRSVADGLARAKYR
jgi:hypothetical protein